MTDLSGRDMDCSMQQTSLPFSPKILTATPPQVPSPRNVEDEVFFGPVSTPEKRKVKKYSRRKTALFVPGFRNDRKLMRYTMLPQSGLEILDEETQKENSPPENPARGDAACASPAKSAGNLSPRVGRSKKAGKVGAIDDLVAPLQSVHSFTTADPAEEENAYVGAASTMEESLINTSSRSENARINIMNDSAHCMTPGGVHFNAQTEISASVNRDSRLGKPSIIDSIPQKHQPIGAGKESGTVCISREADRSACTDEYYAGCVSPQETDVKLCVTDSKTDTTVNGIIGSSGHFKALSGEISTESSAVLEVSNIEDQEECCLSGECPKDILRGFLKGFKASMASDVAIRQFDFSTDHHGNHNHSGNLVTSQQGDVDLADASDLLTDSVLFTDEESMVDSALKSDVCSALESLDHIVDSDKGGAVVRESLDSVSEANSSMSSNGPKPELLIDVCAPTDVTALETPKAVFDLSPLVKSLPALKVTTPMKLHDEQNSAFKMYGSTPDLTKTETSEMETLTAGQTREHPAHTRVLESGGGDSGIEDGGSESPSKISRTSSACTNSPEVPSSVLSPALPETEPASKAKSSVAKKGKTNCPFSPRVTRKAATLGQTQSKPDTKKRDLSEGRHAKTVDHKGPAKSKVSLGAEDRVNSFIRSGDGRPRSSRSPARATPAKSPNLSSARQSRPTQRSRTPKRVDPAEVTERLHSPGPRCCRHNMVKTNDDGRPLWNPSTLVEPSSDRGIYLSSKDPPCEYSLPGASCRLTLANRISSLLFPYACSSCSTFQEPG